MPTQGETKGQRTAGRILDAAETLFAAQGYEGTSLRQIAERAGIREPGLYNHFSGKQALYEVVLHRALRPMAETMALRLDRATELRDYTDLPAIMTDLLLEQPRMAALFQQALRDNSDSVGVRLLQQWLSELFQQGVRSMVPLGAAAEQDNASLAINVIAMLNLVTGYFLSQHAFASMANGILTDPENIEKQKQVLRRVMRAMLIS